VKAIFRLIKGVSLRSMAIWSASGDRIFHRKMRKAWGKRLTSLQIIGKDAQNIALGVVTARIELLLSGFPTF
jgi:hypothetical protein